MMLAKIAFTFPQKIIVIIVTFLKQQFPLDERFVCFDVNRVQETEWPGAVLRQLWIEDIERVDIDFMDFMPRSIGANHRESILSYRHAR
jgi:hypothetical protein